MVFKRHWMVFALAICVSLIYGSTHFFIARELRGSGDVYHPLTFASDGDMAIYGIRANAVYGGQWIAGDISVAESRSSPAVLPILNPIMIGGLGRLVGSLERAFIFSDFLFPPMIFIALYFLAFELTGARALSIFFASVFIFIPKVILPIPPVTPELFKVFINNILPDVNNGLYFSRFEYPKVTFLFYALAFYFTLRAIRRDEKWAVWFAGINFGLLFYTYLYDWVYFFIGVSMMSAMFIFSGRYRDAANLARIIGLGFLISVPYWLNFLFLHQLPNYSDFPARIGVEIGRRLRWASVWKSYARNIVLVILAALALPKKERLILFYLSGFLLAYFAVVNLQIVLGFNPHPDHWYRVSFLPIALGMLAISYWGAKRYFSPRILSYGIIVAILSTSLIMGRSLYSQYLFSKVNARSYVVNKPYATSYLWLAHNAPKGSMVGSISIPTNNELALYTSHRTFILNGFLTTATDAKIWERFIDISVLYGISPKNFSALIPGVIGHLFHNEYRDRSFDYNFRISSDSDYRFPDEIYDRAMSAYETVRTKKLETIASQLDYLYAGPREEALGSVKAVKNLEKVYDREGVHIYKVVKK